MASGVIHGTIGSVWTRGTDSGQRYALGYRPALDGLRGVACLLVLVGHLAVSPALGPVGVVIFFVLSGYLITSLLRNEWEADGRIDLRAFWMRRARRLLPAIVAYVVIVTPLAMLVRSGDDNLRHAAGSLLYFANWQHAAGESMGWYGHIWSLSIEEQFYVLWPLAAVGAFAFGRTRLALVLAGIAVAVIGMRLFADYGLANFATHLRADALLLGCALALWGRPLASWALGVGVAFVIIGGVSSGTSLILGTGVIAGVCLVGVAAYRAIPALTVRPLRYTGRISYGLYLWHAPVTLTLAPWLRDVGLLEPIVWTVAIALSYLMAMASWRWIESPFLAPKPLDPEREVIGVNVRPAQPDHGHP